LIAGTPFRLARQIAALVPAGGPLHHLFKLIPLVGGEHGTDLLPRLLRFLAQFGIDLQAQGADSFLTFSHDLANPLALFGRELQVPFEDLDELTA